MSTAPSKLPRWATAPSPGMPGNIEPPETKKDAGFLNGEEPAAGHFNWLLNLQYQWIEFLAQPSRQMELQALVGSQLMDSTLSEDLRAITGNNSPTAQQVIVAAGQNGKIRRKRIGDPGLWETVTPAGGFNGLFCGACYDPAFNVLVLVGAGMQVQTAPPTTTGAWTARPVDSPGAGYSFDQVVSNGAGILVANPAIGSTGAGSSDGIRVANIATGTIANWRKNSTLDGVAGSGPTTKIAYGSGRFVSAEGYTSVDGSAWFSHGAILAQVMLDIVYSPRFGFIALGFTDPVQGSLWTSPDGVAWTLRASFPQVNWGSRLLTIGRSVFVMVSGYMDGEQLGFLLNAKDDLSEFIYVPWQQAKVTYTSFVTNGIIWSVGPAGRICAGPPLLSY